MSSIVARRTARVSPIDGLLVRIRGGRVMVARVFCCSVRTKTTAFAAATFVACCGVSAAIASADPPPPAPPQPLAAIDHDGTFTVGTDILAGTYLSPGPIGDGTCYWRRVASDGSTIDNALSKKEQIVAIEAGDKSFKTNGCQPWQKTDATPPTGMPPDLAPGLLQIYLNTLNGNAGRAGVPPAPPP
jgi:hypothetical protein